MLSRGDKCENKCTHICEEDWWSAGKSGSAFIGLTTKASGGLVTAKIWIETHLEHEKVSNNEPTLHTCLHMWSRCST